MKITEKEFAEKMAKHVAMCKAKNDPSGFHPVVSFHGKAVRFNGDVVGSIEFGRSDGKAMFVVIRFSHNGMNFVASVRAYSFAKDAKRWFASEVERQGVEAFVRENENVKESND